MIETSEGWASPQRILIVLAHPDDPEFFCGASIARWTRAGHEVRYCLLTRGDKGSSNPAQDPEELACRREIEQRAAAARLGVQKVEFFAYPDGYLVPDLENRKAVVRAIRRHRPDILVSCDPLNYFINDSYINHPDHRSAGEIVINAAFPAAGNPLFFPELIQEEGLQPHCPNEVWLSLTSCPTVKLDVTATWANKVSALHEHRSQIGPDLEAFNARMRDRRTSDSTADAPRYEESFRKIVFRRS